MVRFPHTLVYTEAATEAYQDGEGYWVPGTPGDVLTIPCRAKPNSGGQMLKGADGESLDYRYLVYLPKGTRKIAPQTPVHIYSEDDVLFEGAALQFHGGQINSRLWL